MAGRIPKIEVKLSIILEVDIIISANNVIPTPVKKIAKSTGINIPNIKLPFFVFAGIKN